MAGFGLPNFGQLTEAFKKAKQIQQDAQKLQDELENMEIEGKSDDEICFFLFSIVLVFSKSNISIFAALILWPTIFLVTYIELQNKVFS